MHVSLAGNRSIRIFEAASQSLESGNCRFHHLMNPPSYYLVLSESGYSMENQREEDEGNAPDERDRSIQANVHTVAWPGLVCLPRAWTERLGQYYGSRERSVRSHGCKRFD